MTDLGSNDVALTGLRKSALMLHIGNEYLCAEVYLKKISHNILKDLASLEQGIIAVKKGFPGKFVNEVETDSMVGKVRDLANNMINPEKFTIDKDSVGRLGATLDSDIRSISDAVDHIKRQVKGETGSYNPVSNIVRQTADVGKAFSDMAIKVGKVAVVLILILICSLGLLFLTMPKKSGVINEITRCETEIQMLQSIIKERTFEAQGLSVKISAMEAMADQRSNRIEILKLDMELHSIEDHIQNTEADVTSLQKNIDEFTTSLETMRNTPLIMRVLRINGD